MSKKDFLIETFQKINDNKEDLSNGNIYYFVSDLETYLRGYIYNLFFVNKLSSNKIEKINQSIFYRLASFYNSKDEAFNEIQYSVDEIILNSIYYSLGIDTYKNRNFKYVYNEEFNIVNHTITKVLGVLLNDYLQSIEFKLDYSKDIVYIRDESLISVISSMNIPEGVRSKIFKYLNGDISSKKINDLDIFFLREAWEIFNLR